MAMSQTRWLSIRNFRLRRLGKILQVQVDDHLHTFTLTRGWSYLLALISHPGVPASAWQLECEHRHPVPANLPGYVPAEGKAAGLHYTDNYLPMELGDWRTIAEVKQRLLSVLAEMAVAAEYGNAPRLEELQEEKDELLHYLQELLSYSGGLRCVPGEQQKQRLRVLKAINRSLNQLADCEPELAKYLRWCLHLKQQFVYHPRDEELEFSAD